MSNVFSAVVRLTADSELRSTPNGNQVLGFGIANNQGFGERQTVLFCGASYGVSVARACINT